jgi:hypothetical protein
LASRAVRMHPHHLFCWWGVGGTRQVGQLDSADMGDACQGVWWGWHPLGHGSWWWWQHCCIAAAVGMMTVLSTPSTACVIFLGVRIASGRLRRWVPTWLLPACCLYLSISSCFLLLSFSLSLSFPFLPISPLHTQIERVVDLAFVLI